MDIYRIWIKLCPILGVEFRSLTSNMTPLNRRTPPPPPPLYRGRTCFAVLLSAWCNLGIVYVIPEGRAVVYRQAQRVHQVSDEDRKRGGAMLLLWEHHSFGGAAGGLMGEDGGGVPFNIYTCLVCMTYCLLQLDILTSK